MIEGCLLGVCCDEIGLLKDSIAKLLMIQKYLHMLETFPPRVKRIAYSCKHQSI